MPLTWLSVLGEARSYGVTQARLSRAERTHVYFILFVCVWVVSSVYVCMYARVSVCVSAVSGFVCFYCFCVFLLCVAVVTHRIDHIPLHLPAVGFHGDSNADCRLVCECVFVFLLSGDDLEEQLSAAPKVAVRGAVTRLLMRNLLRLLPAPLSAPLSAPPLT